MMAGDSRNRDVVDVNVLLANQVEQQVERAFIDAADADGKREVVRLLLGGNQDRAESRGRLRWERFRNRDFCFFGHLTRYFASGAVVVFGGSYSRDMPIASRTSFMVAQATLRACSAPASRISQASRGFSSYCFRRSCMGLRICTSASAAQPLHSMHPMPADRHPTLTLSMVAGLLKILCKSPTGQTSGLPGSVRRTRAGSVTMVFSFWRTTGSGSGNRMYLP